jgi:hypothetical protein
LIERYCIYGTVFYKCHQYHHCAGRCSELYNFEWLTEKDLGKIEFTYLTQYTFVDKMDKELTYNKGAAIHFYTFSIFASAKKICLNSFHNKDIIFWVYMLFKSLYVYFIIKWFL